MIPKSNYTCWACRRFFLVCFFSSCGQFGPTVSYNEFQCQEISMTTAAATLLSFWMLIWLKCYFQSSLELEECDIFCCNNAVYKWCTLGNVSLTCSHNKILFTFQFVRGMWTGCPPSLQKRNGSELYLGQKE